MRESNIILKKMFLCFISLLFIGLLLTATPSNAARKKVAKPKRTSVKVKDLNNSNATISWSKLSNVDGYIVYRKVEGHAYRRIAKVGRSVTSYKDHFYKSINPTDKGYLNTRTNGKNNTFLYRNNCFVDPSCNPFIYTVRGYKKVRGKTYLGDYYSSGANKLSSAVITNAKKNSNTSVSLTWARVPGADGYYIYQASSSASYGVHYATVKQTKYTRINALVTKTLNCKSTSSRFAVRAYRVECGKTILASKYGSFSVNEQKYSDNRILFLGDSITYGIPYRGEDIDIYSFPYRVKQRTGAEIYNASVPSGHITRLLSHYNGKSILDSVIQPLTVGEDIYSYIPNLEVEYPLHHNELGYSLKDFDIIVMDIGTNDYDSSSDPGRYLEALTEAFDAIRVASQQRIQEGKEPIKFICMDLFCRDRYNTIMYSVSKNRLGYTLGTYQNIINNLCQSYGGLEDLEIYHMPTSAYVSVKRMNSYTITIPSTGKKIYTKNCNYSTSDNLHLTRETYANVGDGLVNFMIKNGILKNKIIKDNTPKEDISKDNTPREDTLM